MAARILFLLVLWPCFSAELVKAQNNSPSSSNPLNTYLNNYAQPAPNAASLGQYADYPVGYYTGVPQISVPVYNLKDGGITLPISLSYHASGIRVSELASWVGLGWALNATGVINRTVRGAPDEGSRKSTGLGGNAPTGYYKDHGLFSLITIPYPVASNNNKTSDPQGIFYGTVAPAILSGAADCESDLYIFNFNGVTGKFVFDEKGTPRLLEDNNLKIKVQYNASTKMFDSWEIITPDGIQYYFGENKAYELTRSKNTSQQEDENTAVPSSWYLTRIVNPNTKDAVQFNYDYECYSYYDLGPESMLYGTAGGGPRSTVNFTNDNSFINNNGQVDNLISTTVQGLKLKSIVSKNYTVKFVASSVRSDLDYSSNLTWKNPDNTYSNVTYSAPCSLDSIKVYSNATNACLRQFALTHGYFVSAATGTAQVVINSVGGSSPSDSKRLKLVSLNEISSDGTSQKPPYVFSYQEGSQLPRRLSYDQDHWGYSNNSSGNRNSFFTPAVFCNYSTYGSAGAARRAVWPDMSAFTLNGVKNPLGVNTNFYYGANSAGNGVNPNVNPSVTDTLVGGLRIQQIRVTDNVSGVVKVRSFSYSLPQNNQPGGVLIHMPVYLIQPYNEFYLNTSQGDATLLGLYGDTFNQSSGGANGEGTQFLKQSQGIVPMQDANGNHVVYPYVKEVFGQSGNGGSKTYHFDLASLAISNGGNSSKLAFSNFAAYGTLNATTYGNASGFFGNGHLNDTLAYSNVLPQNLVYTSNFRARSQDGYPAAPVQADLNSGKLLEENTYDAAGNLIEYVSNTYSTNYHENFWLRGLRAYVPNVWAAAYHNSTTPTYDEPTGYNGLTYYKLHTGIAHLMSSVKKTYNGSNYTTETTTYSYESPAHTLPTEQSITNSKGVVLTKKTYYSFDYSPNAGNAYTKFYNRNLLLPVSEYTWRNSLLTSGKVSQFQDFAATSADTLLYPSKVYALEAKAPLTESQAGVTKAFVNANATLIPNTTIFAPRATFLYDNYTGKLNNQQLTTGRSQAFKWSTGLGLPVAVVENASNTSSMMTTAITTTNSNYFTMARGSSQTYTTTFTVSASGTTNISIGFSGNPGTNALVQVNCNISGPANYSSNALCIATGTANCNGTGSSKIFNSLPQGTYTLTAQITQQQNLISNVNFNCSYPVISSSTSTTGAAEFYYEGFEESSLGTVGVSHTGTKGLVVNSYTVNWNSPTTRSYIISYWYRSAGVWNLKEDSYTGSSYTLTGGDAYDDVRIFPKDAQMTTYTYNAQGDVTSSTDSKNYTTYYDYDPFYRLLRVRDQNGNVLKDYNYHYANY